VVTECIDNNFVSYGNNSESNDAMAVSRVRFNGGPVSGLNDFF